VDTNLVWGALALGLGLLAGPATARASVQMPGAGRAVSGRRYAVCTLACALAAIWAWATSPGLLAPIGAVLGAQLVLIALLDAEHFWLPHRLTVPLGLMGLAEAAALEPGQLIHRLIGAAAGFAVLAAIAFAYRRARGREGMGGGDFRLLGAAGAWVGWVGLPSVLVLACAGGLAMVGARALAGRGLRPGEAVPFGVFLAAGLWLTWLYGPLGRAG